MDGCFDASYNIAPNLIVSFGEEEQQKLDGSGRQFYLNLKYKF